MPLIPITTLEAELELINTAILTYLQTGQPPVNYTLPTGHSIDQKDTLAIMLRWRQSLLDQIAQMDPAYVVSVGG